MSKKILSLLLVLVLLVTVSAFAVEATDTTDTTVETNRTRDEFDVALGHSYNEETGEHSYANEPDTVKDVWCEACQAQVTWKKATYDSSKRLSVKTGHIYIPSAGSAPTANTVVNNSTEAKKFCLYVNGDYTRNLDGKTTNAYLFRMYYKGSATNIVNIFNVMGNGRAKLAVTGELASASSQQNGAVINTSSIVDSNDVGISGSNTVNIYAGVIIDASGVDTTKNTNTKGSAIAPASKGTINVYGGKIIGGKSYYGGTAYVGSGALNLYGGEIIGGIATATSYGGGAVAQGGGTINMYKGAKITGGDSQNYSGGAVYVRAGTFNMYGGEILAGKCKSSMAGSGVSVYPTSTGTATFNMYGGRIYDDENSATSVVYTRYDGATFNMDDTVALPSTVPAGVEKDATAVIETSYLKSVYMNTVSSAVSLNKL